LLIHEEPGLRVDLVSDGIYWMDAGAMFGLVPKVLWGKHMTADDLNRLPLALNCLLVREEGRTTLVDTGFGTKIDERGLGVFGLDGARPGLVQSLAAAGVTPKDVDLVVNTHLHADHCGGNTRLEGGEAVPTFPNATYVVQRIELAEATFPDARTRATYLAANFAPLGEANQLEVVDADCALTPRLRTVVTRGHTRSHQSVIVEPEGAPPIVFLGDVAPWAVHLERVAWVPAIDVLPLDSLETKRSMARWLIEHDALCVLQHDTVTPIGRLTEGDGHFKFEPEPAI
jgi:glyoxylase-like metal-dependent hydrolase (beta-lactamase superfamily II)